MKLSDFGIKLNIASAGTGSVFVSKFHSYSYWFDKEKQIKGKKIIMAELWVGNAKIVRIFQNSYNKVLFFEIRSWPKKDKNQITIAEFSDDSSSFPDGSIEAIYEFIMTICKKHATDYVYPKKILNILEKIRASESTENLGVFD